LTLARTASLARHPVPSDERASGLIALEFARGVGITKEQVSQPLKEPNTATSIEIPALQSSAVKRPLIGSGTEVTERTNNGSDADFLLTVNTLVS